jgi:peptidoglycan/LPS O-acetylase OafA/YrhL
MIFHLDKAYLPGGFVGVDIFFVISGYVVSASLLRAQSSTVGALLLGFYARRIKRLTPALLTMVVLSSLAISMLLPSRTHDDFYASAQLALVGLANLHFALLPTGYFDEGAQK